MQLLGHKNVQSIYNYSHVSQKTTESMSKILSGSTSIFQTETHSLVETEHNNKVQRRQQQSYSGMLCFTEEISTSTRPRLQQKHINNKLIEE